MWIRLKSGNFVNLATADKVISKSDGVVTVWWASTADAGARDSVELSGEDAALAVKLLSIEARRSAELAGGHAG